MVLVPSNAASMTRNRPCFERQIVQNEALYKCRLLLFEDHALDTEPWGLVLKGYQDSNLDRAGS